MATSRFPEPLPGVNALARRIRSKRISAVEALEMALARIDALNPKLNAFITVSRKSAMDAALRADRAVAQGKQLGPLHGVPIALKDNYETRGIRTTAGSRVYEHHIPMRDATVTERLQTAGAIIVGKTHLNEFARGPAVFGEIHNPWNHSHTPGGSSAGSGVAVSAGMVPIAMGHDTGGSTRIPAAHCGVSGLKGTYGLVSRAGVMPLEWSMDNPGPIARTVEDIATVLSVIAGYDSRDPASIRKPIPSYRRRILGGIQNVRIGVPSNWFFDIVDPEVKQAVLEGISLLETLGASTSAVQLPLAKYVEEIGDQIVFGGATAWHRDNLRDHRDQYGPIFLQSLESRLFLSATDYIHAQRLRREMRTQFLEALTETDIIITPTCPLPAQPLGNANFEVDGTPTSGFYTSAAFTRPFSLTGLPALTIPCGFTAGGLPIGMQIAGRPFDEATVLRVGNQYQHHTDWHKRRPNL